MSLGTCSVNSFAVCFQNWKLKGIESPWDNTWPIGNESCWRKTAPFHLLGGKLLAPPLHLPFKRLPWVELHLLTATSFIMCFYLAFSIFLFHFSPFFGVILHNYLYVGEPLSWALLLGKPRLRYPLICLPLLFLLIESSLSWKPKQFLWKHWSNYITSLMTSHLMQSKNRPSLIWPLLIYPTLLCHLLVTFFWSHWLLCCSLSMLGILLLKRLWACSPLSLQPPGWLTAFISFRSLLICHLPERMVCPYHPI